MNNVIEILILSTLLGQSSSANISMTFSLNVTNLEIVCPYSLAKSDKFEKLLVTKDDQTFVTLTSADPKNPQFNAITEIDLAKTKVVNSELRVTIYNYKPNVGWGNYACKLFFNGIKEVKATYKLNLTVDKCKMQWQDASKGNIPNGAFVAAMNGDDQPLIVCKFPGGTPGYYDPNRGCIDTMVGRIEFSTTFQVITGYHGLSWPPRNKSVARPNFPVGAIEFGKDGTGPLYLGRCNAYNSAFIGKVGDDFWFNYKEKEVSDCQQYNVLACVP